MYLLRLWHSRVIRPRKDNYIHVIGRQLAGDKASIHDNSANSSSLCPHDETPQFFRLDLAFG